MIRSAGSGSPVKVQDVLLNFLVVTLTHGLIFNNIVACAIDDLLSSFINESTQGGTLGGRYSCAVDW